MRIKLNGEVVADEEMWLYEYFEVPAFSPQTVRDALMTDEPLTLEINSSGGSVFAAFEIYTILRNSSVYTVAEVQSIAASAASVLMLGCDEVTASPVAQIMIHLPSVSTQGDRDDHQDSINVLDSVTESILNAYAIKCAGYCSRDDLRRMMNASSWLTAPEAKELGLIDSIIGEDRFDPSSVLNSVSGAADLIRASAAPKRTAEELRMEYQKLVTEGKAPERAGFCKETPAQKNSHELQTAVAVLELEKLRFL